MTLVQLMEITDANIAGIVHGGVIMKLVDTAAGLAAFKHAGGHVRHGLDGRDVVPRPGATSATP